MNDDQARERLRRLLHGQSLGVLATSGGESPHASLIAFAATDDLREIVFATSRATLKFKLLQQRPCVALLVDDRSNEVGDFRDASAATANGLAAEVEAGRLGELRKLYVAKHPDLEEFAGDPSCALVSVKIERYDLVVNFQEVHVLRPEGRPDASAQNPDREQPLPPRGK
jgi:nitroimidazol reductase NimA-like FMN-containing flavoprotein (pyridoxamine 5'-phosphate oxidase superfamily)